MGENMCGTDDVEDLKLFKVGNGFLVVEKYGRNGEGMPSMHQFSYDDRKDAMETFNEEILKNAKKIPVFGKGQIVVSPADYVKDFEEVLNDAADDIYCEMELSEAEEKLLDKFIKLLEKTVERKLKEW